MYIAYNYCPGNSFYNNCLNKYLSIGKKRFEEHKREVERCLSKYITEDGEILGSDLKENWFSVEANDIFISHSHKDINRVIAFAGWLYDRFNLNSFIDFCSWGYCDELLNKIDKRFCYDKKKKTYNYNLRNYTTSHVHMMLATALTETMSKSECVIFFNTPNSIIMKEELDRVKRKERTVSPWIMYELTILTEMRREKPIRALDNIEHRMRGKDEMPNIQYDVTKTIQNIPTLNDSHLKKMEEEYTNLKRAHPLDVLYEITSEN